MTVKVVKSDPPETTEILAEAIVRLGDSVRKLDASGLNHKAIVILLQDATKLPRRDIESILTAIPRLKSWYCR